MANQSGKKDDVEFIIAGDDNVSQILKGIVNELQGVRNQAKQTGRDVGSSLDQVADSSRRAGEGVQTVGERLRDISQGVTHIKKLNNELEQTENQARDAGREMERGFRDGGRAVDQAANRIAVLKQRVLEVAHASRNMMDAINNGTAGFQSFVGDQIRRGAYVGGLAVTGFAAHSVMKNVDKDYEFAKLGSTLKSGYYKNGVLDESAYKKDFEELKQFLEQQGLRKDREQDTIGMIGIAQELSKNNMGPVAIEAASPVVADFAQATGLDPDVAAKYLANKLEAAKMAYTPEDFAKVSDQFVKTVDMSSLDPRDLLYAEKYTDFASAIGKVDFAIPQAMQVLLSRVSVEGETAGTTLRTLFLESSKLGISESARSNVSSEKVGNIIDALISDVNAVNKAVDADKSIAADQKGNEKILRKARIMSNYVSRLTNDEQLEVGSLLFGKEAAAATTIFAGDGYNELLQVIDALRNSQGITKQYADDRANTDKGQIVALGKAIDEIQGKVGKSLDPLLEATTKQLLSLAAEGKFSFEEISKGVEQASELLAKELNPEIAETFQQLTDLATNGFQVGVALSPMAKGTFEGLVKLLNGDVSGAAKEIVLAIDATDLRIENLPGELQGLANAAQNAAIGLAVFWAATKAVEIGKTGKEIWDAGQKFGDAVRGKKDTGSNASSDDDRVIRANVVNVYGGKINGGNSSDKGGSAPVPVPATRGGAADGKSQDGDLDSQKKQGKWKTNVGRAAGWGGTGLLLASMFGLTDGLPEGVQEAIDYYGWGAALNNLLGNPLGALEAGAGTALSGTAVVGGTWAWGLGSYTDYVNENYAKNHHNKYGPVGADKWLTASANHELEPASSGDKFTGAYFKEKSAVIDFLMSKKESKYAPFLTGFSDQLLNEAKVNASHSTQYLLTGYGGGNIESYLQKRLNEYYLLLEGSDPKALEVEKRLKRQTDKDRDEHQLQVQGNKDRIQYLRELDQDPFTKGSYKRQLLDEMTQRPSPTNTSTQLIPALMAHLSKLEEKPITVHSDHNLKVLVEDNRAVQVQMESVSDRVNRTPGRTLTPMQSVKMRDLETRI